MPEYLAPGVFVEEVPAGVRPIEGVSTSTVGMVGVAERGPVNVPTLVTSFGAYQRLFGGFLNGRVFTGNRDAMPFAVKGFFDNGGGRIYVNRIVGTAASYASVDLFGNAPTNPATTALSARAASDATELRIDDGANIANGDVLLISNGARSEYVTATSDPVAIGAALTGTVHVTQPDGVAVVLQNAPVAGADLTAQLTGDMAAGGGLLLSAAGLAGLSAGDILRLRDTGDETLTEYVTITAAGAAGIEEGALLFDHPQATAEVMVVTLGDSATATTLAGEAGAGTGLIRLADTAGIADGAIIAVGVAPTREFHVVRSVVSQLSIATTPTTAIHAAGTPVLRQVPLLRVHARYEGQWGNQLRLRVRASPSTSTTVSEAAAASDSPVELTTTVGLHPGSVVAVLAPGAPPTELARQRVTAIDRAANEVEFAGGAAAAFAAGSLVVSQEFTLIVERIGPDGKVLEDEAFDFLALDPSHPRYAPTIVGAFDRATGEPDEIGASDLVRLSDLTRDDSGVDNAGAADLRRTLPFDGVMAQMTGGDDDLATIDNSAYIGVDSADVDDRTGISALTAIDDISIVAVPGQTAQTVQNALIGHCELMRYRVAVLDGIANARLADIQAQRQLYDSTRAALYHPWLLIADPFGRPDDRLVIPPSGHVCGIYARTDTERGVFKAPANEVVRNILDLASTITTGEQEILNPRGINVIRDFRNLGRGLRVWGARTASSEGEWRYVPVRRTFLFVEKSIERGTQFAVFEPNGPPLWATIKRSVTNFLTVVWRDGALAGNSPEEAFFVDVGFTTMTQADIDLGRLIVMVGIAPVKPAEFVIFRIQQKTAGTP